MKTVVPGKHSNSWFVPNVKSGEALVSLIYRENLKLKFYKQAFYMCLLGALSKPHNFFFTIPCWKLNAVITFLLNYSFIK